MLSFLYLLFYNILVLIAIPIVAPILIFIQILKGKRIPLNNRLGGFNVPARGHASRVWFDALSLGEVVALMPILKKIKANRPDCEIVLSLMSSRSFDAIKTMSEKVVDHVVYVPYDTAFFQYRAMRIVKPDAVVMVEGGLWLHMLWAAKRIGAKTLMVNGRFPIQKCSLMRRLRFHYRVAFQYLDRAGVQFARDQELLSDLGAKNISLLGSCKLDEALKEDAESGTIWRKRLGIPAEAFVLVIGSTRDDQEENFVLEAIQSLRLERFYVVHAPRFLEDIPRLRAKIEKNFRECAQYSKMEKACYILLDTHGDLGNVYAAASLAIVGGAFGLAGGHNFVQPLGLGKPVLHGRNFQNNAEIVELARPYGCLICCATPKELGEQIRALLDDSARLQEISRSAKRFVEEHAGAADRYAQAILECLPDSK